MRSTTPAQLRAQALRGLSSTELHGVIGAAHRTLGPGRHAHPLVEHALERALETLRGAARPMAVKLFARALAAEIASALIDPAEGCERLVQLAREAPDALDAHPWLELQDEVSLADSGALGRAEVEQRIREAARAFLAS